MNILVLSWRDPKHPMAGGAEQVMHEHMKGWIAAGHKVTFFSSRFPGSKQEEKLDGVDIVRQGKDLFLGVQLSAFWWYLFGSHDKFDLVIDEFHGIPFFTPLYVRVPKLAVLQEVAREVWWLNPLPKPFNWIIGWIGYTLEPFLFLFYRDIPFINKSVPFMTGSQSAKDDLARMGIKSNDITIVPHGVIIETPSKLPPKEKENTIVFLGALTRDKGIEDALRAFAILSKNGNDNLLWIIGVGISNYVTHLKKLSRRLGIEGKIKFFGFVSQKEKFELLARAHVLINPSIREGWGLVNIEANRMGTPVVAYRSPGLVDSVKDGQSGVVCKVNTPGNLSREIEKILSSPQTYKTFQYGSRRWASQFNWEKSKKLSLKLLENIK
ncbi:MAG: hypothetical protein A2782_02935 [Candidatus Blackburnbacteria bacterium RIFCSPHIGHO2_01_FULL_43_15b]|uniref:Glycosyl transferase family 1 domain-containing protein n=1 Tax=Candidatus Blackburnbacteria bacterium RIFCSPHIGHO2_01_FULL_43_15b TaxID=1797513 RepID=A0A1G1V326_9BACT|nr:MAG: hypothetical protein A2782_02935 [Candidatus Blackburnbacteria bacterium RIFCSPHIGHO2_01_FULL_43_15b]